MPFIKKEPFTKEEQCISQEHNPPMNMYLGPGRYTWQCPSCGKETIFEVPSITMSV